MSNKPRVTAAMIVEHEGKILLARRNKKNRNGFWVIPGGGVDFGETLENAAVREVKEETNVDVEDIQFVGFQELINVPGEYHAVVFFHKAKALTTVISASDDVSDAQFFTIDEIKELETVKSVQIALTEAGLWN
jgi:8-oxo-dGTP diphosphatase